MNFLKALSFIAAVCAFANVAQACPTGLRPFNKQLGGKDTCVLEKTYVGNLELTSGFNYILLGAVFIGEEVRDGNATLMKPIQSGKLTINPGVTVYALNPKNDTTGLWDGFKTEDGQLVQGDIKTFMSVTRDSRIEILGKENAPVVMTSAQGAHLTDSAAVKRPGDWGGLVISGKAKSNRCPADFKDCTIPGEANTGWYGGDDDNHSSGVVQYLQVEFGGDRIDSEKELNGVTFNSVGLGTIIENVAVLYNSDDCIEFFGGAAVARNIFCYNGEDDGIDTTDGARVFLQNGIVVAADYPDAGEDNDRHMVEADSSKSDPANQLLRSHPVLVNFTFVGGVNSQGLKIRRGSDYTLVNSIMFGVDLWCMDPAGAATLNFMTNMFADCGSNDPIKSIGSNDYVTMSQIKMSKWVPQAGSPVLSGATEMEVFSDDPNLDEAFYDAYEAVTYRGAVGSKDWTQWIQTRD